MGWASGEVGLETAMFLETGRQSQAVDQVQEDVIAEHCMGCQKVEDAVCAVVDTASVIHLRWRSLARQQQEWIDLA